MLAVKIQYLLSFSSDGGATKTTNGMRSECLRMRSDCGWRLSTQMRSAMTTERMASRLVP